MNRLFTLWGVEWSEQLIENSSHVFIVDHLDTIIICIFIDE